MKQSQSASLEAVANYFASWRQNRESKREPIPGSLRNMAATLKNRYPVGQIKIALNVNSSMLKQWSNEADHSTHHSPSFLPLPPADVVNDKVPRTVKLEYPNGTRLILTGEIPNDTLLTLARSLAGEMNP